MSKTVNILEARTRAAKELQTGFGINAGWAGTMVSQAYRSGQSSVVQGIRLDYLGNGDFQAVLVDAK
jgi:hypothetical protein